MTTLTAWIEPRLARLPRRLALQWPGGGWGEQTADVRLKLAHRKALAWLARGEVGALADAYVLGELEIEGALEDVMLLAAVLVGDPVQRGTRPWWQRLLALLHSRLLHVPHRDAALVRRHYDLCSAFHALWLDPARVYSCAYFADDSMTLAQAQEAKLALVCSKLQLAPGQRFLDIGAGWGGLLIWAARHHGVQATGITVSKEQHAHVTRLIDEHGLRGQVDIKLLDYRALADDPRCVGAFDRIASVGMFEHVGRARLVGYFGHLRRLLRPGGLLLNHGIAAAAVHNGPLGGGMGQLIGKHIFPGGELVHVSQAVQALSQQGLELLDAENLRPHYARTLWHWSQALERQLAQATALTDAATVRAYRLYLAGSAMCFERRWLSLYQLLASRPDGRAEDEPMRGALSDYRFRRGHMLGA